MSIRSVAQAPSGKLAPEFSFQVTKTATCVPCADQHDARPGPQFLQVHIPRGSTKMDVLMSKNAKTDPHIFGVLRNLEQLCGEYLASWLRTDGTKTQPGGISGLSNTELVAGKFVAYACKGVHDNQGDFWGWCFSTPDVLQKVQDVSAFHMGMYRVVHRSMAGTPILQHPQVALADNFCFTHHS